MEVGIHGPVTGMEVVSLSLIACMEVPDVKHRSAMEIEVYVPVASVEVSCF